MLAAAILGGGLVRQWQHGRLLLDPSAGALWAAYLGTPLLLAGLHLGTRQRWPASVILLLAIFNALFASLFFGPWFGLAAVLSMLVQFGAALRLNSVEQRGAVLDSDVTPTSGYVEIGGALLHALLGWAGVWFLSFGTGRIWDSAGIKPEAVTYIATALLIFLIPFVLSIGHVALRVRALRWLYLPLTFLHLAFAVFSFGAGGVTFPAFLALLLAVLAAFEHDAARWRLPVSDEASV
ncbi:MAG: hypothetical protein WCI61_08125 [Chloroflexota bacterium]